MKETIFTLQKGTEVPVRFDGATVPIMVASNNEDMLKIAGDKAYVVFNRAHSLDVQKAVKAHINSEPEEGKPAPSIESARKLAADSIKGDYYKDAGERARGDGTPKAVTKQAVNKVLGDDFLAMLTPQQRAVYDQKMAEQEAKRTAKKPEATPAVTPTPAPATPAPRKRT